MNGFAFEVDCDPGDAWLDASGLDKTCWAMISLDVGGETGELVPFDGIELCKFVVSGGTDVSATTVVPVWVANSTSRFATASLIAEAWSRL